jgi:putative transcriptional regulator
MTRNQITHHLTDALLMAYSAGSLPEAFNLTVATHLSMCDDCRARAAAFDSVGGAMIDGADTVEMGQDSLAATMARIRAGKPQREKLREIADKCPVHRTLEKSSRVETRVVDME